MKNKVKWKDIVKVNGEYHLETFDVQFEDEYGKLNDVYLGESEKSIIDKIGHLTDYFKDDTPLYNCDNFFDSVREKYGIAEDEDVETYLFDDFENVPDGVLMEFDVAWLGGYINGINI